MLWVGEPTKNLAWQYLDKTRCDLKEFEKDIKDERTLALAWREIYIAEGSDWFWWYGEPNDSGQDNIFDLLFLSHLKNMYKIVGKPVPPYLEAPLTDSLYTGSRHPKGEVEDFELTGNNPQKWENAGCIEIPATPTIQEKRFFNKICFMHDKNYLYLRFDVNKFIIDKELGFKDFYQIYVYFKNKSSVELPKSNIRTLNKTEDILPLVKEKYSNEIRMTFFRKLQFSGELATANTDNLWFRQLKNNIESVFDEFVEVKIPFDNINIKPGETLEFFVIQGTLGVIDDFFPRDSLLSVTRPEQD